jgi:hypothetical protein
VPITSWSGPTPDVISSTEAAIDCNEVCVRCKDGEDVHWPLEMLHHAGTLRDWMQDTRGDGHFAAPSCPAATLRLLLSMCVHEEAASKCSRKGSEEGGSNQGSDECGSSDDKASASNQGSNDCGNECSNDEENRSPLQSLSICELLAVMDAANFLAASAPLTSAAHELCQRFLHGKSVMQLRTALCATDDLSKVEQAVALAESVLTPPSVGAASVPLQAAPPMAHRSLSSCTSEVVLETALQTGCDVPTLCRLKAVSSSWRERARRELCSRLYWCKEPPSPARIEDLNVQVLWAAERPHDAVAAEKNLPHLARLHGYGFEVDISALRAADLSGSGSDSGSDSGNESDLSDSDPEDPHSAADQHSALLGCTALRCCIKPDEGEPPYELLVVAMLWGGVRMRTSAQNNLDRIRMAFKAWRSRLQLQRATWLLLTSFLLQKALT